VIASARGTVGRASRGSGGGRRGSSGIRPLDGGVGATGTLNGSCCGGAPAGSASYCTTFRARPVCGFASNGGGKLGGLLVCFITPASG
jgi:hypothetical protein